jgi:DNA sulfur modification protein DndC
MSSQPTLFDAQRSERADSIDLTIRSLQAYGPTHRHWAIAYSGGKDSTALVTLVVWLIQSGQIPAPESLTVLYADTRMELTPLAIAAEQTLRDLRARGIDARMVTAPMDKRFLVYILGRGVPPPNNNTLRWCTRQIKVDPMAAELKRLSDELRSPAEKAFLASARPRIRELVVRAALALTGAGAIGEDLTSGWESLADAAAVLSAAGFATDEIEALREAAMAPSLAGYIEGVDRTIAQSKILMLTGVRQGESAIRDNRIAMSCGRNGGECGQGWYQETLPDALCDTLAPLLHWRVCHIWDWLLLLAPELEYGGWATALVAEAYGGDEAEEMNARTGCNGCPLATKDTALEGLVRLYPERWGYLALLRELRPIFRWLREPAQRLRKAGGEARRDGTPVANQYRMGPLTFEARLQALAAILDIQERINAEARRLGRPAVDMLNAEEVARIEELIDLKTWPNRWSGEEPRADQPYEEIVDGVVQMSITAALEEAGF